MRSREPTIEGACPPVGNVYHSSTNVLFSVKVRCDRVSGRVPRTWGLPQGLLESRTGVTFPAVKKWFTRDLALISPLIIKAGPNLDPSRHHLSLRYVIARGSEVQRHD